MNILTYFATSRWPGPGTCVIRFLPPSPLAHRSSHPDLDLRQAGRYLPEYRALEKHDS